MVGIQYWIGRDKGGRKDGCGPIVGQCWGSTGTEALYQDHSVEPCGFSPKLTSTSKYRTKEIKQLQKIQELKFLG